jgi:hypothetical protein
MHLRASAEVTEARNIPSQVAFSVSDQSGLASTNATAQLSGQLAEPHTRKELYARLVSGSSRLAALEN